MYSNALDGNIMVHMINIISKVKYQYLKKTH